MDATTRWETEAIRSSHAKRATPPRPSSKRATSGQGSRTWLTLKEAEEATGIPTNTLRKWVRKESVDTYLESDGEIALRMVALDSIRSRAKELGREIAPIPTDGDSGNQRSEVRSQKSEVRDQKSEVDIEPESDGDREVPNAESVTGETMLVPIDAWNKMLDQLGNLHEAGQQLADARERAAKAETEATFLRERLKEMREEASASAESWQSDLTDTGSRMPDDGPLNLEPERRNEAEGDDGFLIPDPGQNQPDVASRTESADNGPDTTTYWRYLTSGWRQRKRN